MAHEITATDNLVLTQKKAWHGLGVIVEDAPSPREALKLAGLDWEVDQWPLVAQKGNLSPAQGGEEKSIPSHVANIRRDTESVLGIVTGGYEVVQNSELADFAEALAKNGDKVKIETAGSIRGGVKVWFLIRGESFSVRGDEIKPYICLSNGHDGWSSLRGDLTSVRVVCSNTLHMVIPNKTEAGAYTGRLTQAGFTCRHVGNVMERVQEAQKALRLYENAVEETRPVLDAVAAKDVNSEMFKQFFLQCYVNDFGAVPMNPVDAKEQRKNKKALEAFSTVNQIFEKESKIVGTNLWAAVNAYTGYIQHTLTPRVKDLVAKEESKTHSRLFGTDAQRSSHALQVALSMVL